MRITNYPNIKYVESNITLGVFYGVTDLGVPVWGRFDEGMHASEVHPLYVRNLHTNIIGKRDEI